MAKILQLKQLGQPILRQKTKPVHDIHSAPIRELINDLISSLLYDGGLGIAGPQVFESMRLFVMQTCPVPAFPDTPETEPFAVINPEILSHSDETISLWESCKSIPGLRGQVPRYRHIQVKYFNRKGGEETAEFSDFGSIVFQHEFDHLNGVVWLDRVEDTHLIMTDQEYQRMLKNI